MTNQNQSEVEMWWADLDECPEEDDISVGTLLRKHPRQGPLKWQESLFTVVKKSDYDKLKEENQRLKRRVLAYANAFNAYKNRAGDYAEILKQECPERLEAFNKECWSLEQLKEVYDSEIEKTNPSETPCNLT